MNIPETMFHQMDIPQGANFSDEAALTSQQMMVDKHVASATFDFKVSSLRQQLPSVVITPFPNTTTTVNLAVTTATDICIPDGAKLVRIRAASGATVFASRNGAAQIPGNVPDSTTGCFIPDTSTYYYVGELRSFSLISPAQAFVTLEWFLQQ